MTDESIYYFIRLGVGGRPLYWDFGDYDFFQQAQKRFPLLLVDIGHDKGAVMRAARRWWDENTGQSLDGAVWAHNEHRKLAAETVAKFTRTNTLEMTEQPFVAYIRLDDHAAPVYCDVVTREQYQRIKEIVPTMLMFHSGNELEGRVQMHYWWGDHVATWDNNCVWRWEREERAAKRSLQDFQGPDND